MDIFSDESRRNPYPLYAELRGRTPVFRIPPPFDAWMILDFDGVNRALNDHEAFSSRVPAPANWFIFEDGPRHARQRSLISRAFTPRMMASLDPVIRALSRSLLDQCLDRGTADLAGDFAVPLAMKVIAHIIGIPGEDWLKFRTWSDSILKITYSRGADDEAKRVMNEFAEVTAAMSEYLAAMIAARRRLHADDLLSRLMTVEVDGQRLTHDEILGFFQLLLVAGQETTANLIDNAVLSLLENPDQMERLRADPRLLPAAIDETLRYRAPIQWVMRTPTRDVEMHGQTLVPGRLVLAVVGSANRDPKHVERPDQFDIARNPNAHIAFGGGSHFCLGSVLARMEARIALGDLLESTADMALTGNQPWEPRRALNVHGPARLPIKFTGIGAGHRVCGADATATLRCASPAEGFS